LQSNQRLFCSINIEKLCSLVGISSLTVVSYIVHLFYNIAQATDAENYLRLLNNSNVAKKFHDMFKPLIESEIMKPMKLLIDNRMQNLLSL
jgi:hypothetical protein